MRLSRTKRKSPARTFCIAQRARAESCWSEPVVLLFFDRAAAAFSSASGCSSPSMMARARASKTPAGIVTCSAKTASQSKSRSTVSRLQALQAGLDDLVLDAAAVGAHRLLDRL